MILGDYIQECKNLGMRPFLLSLLAGVWFVVLNILNACTQPPAEVVLKSGVSPYAKSGNLVEPEKSIPVVQSSPVETISSSELPSLHSGISSAPVRHPEELEQELQQLQQPKPAMVPVSVEEKPLQPNTFHKTPADPSITEIIETGERLTFEHSGNQTHNPAPVPILKQKATASSTFIWPVNGEVTSQFGIKPGGLRNDGINIAAGEGTPIRAVADGEVLYMNGDMKGAGSLILLRHANGWVSTYAHNKDISVKQGDKVQQGDVIAYVGKTGNVTKPQLHFSLRKDKKPMNPEKYLATSFAQNR